MNSYYVKITIDFYLNNILLGICQLRKKPKWVTGHSNIFITETYFWISKEAYLLKIPSFSFLYFIENNSSVNLFLSLFHIWYLLYGAFPSQVFYYALSNTLDIGPTLRLQSAEENNTYLTPMGSSTLTPRRVNDNLHTKLYGAWVTTNIKADHYHETRSRTSNLDDMWPVYEKIKSLVRHIGSGIDAVVPINVSGRRRG